MRAHECVCVCSRARARVCVVVVVVCPRICIRHVECIQLKETMARRLTELETNASREEQHFLDSPKNVVVKANFYIEVMQHFV